MNLISFKSSLPGSFSYFGLLFCLLATPAVDLVAQSAIAVKKELVWFRAGNEISSPQFSDDGSRIVFVTRVHVADGHEAESLPESYFKKIEERQKKEPRFADPIIEMIDVQGKVVCEASYGWNPSIAPDGNAIVFSAQQKPITGFRVLAETQAGNDIELRDCEKKQTTVLAQPDPREYLDTPRFLTDGTSVSYSVNRAVNGAYGDAVGLERIDLLKHEKTVLLSQERVSNVPCPAKDSAQLSGHQAFVCSQFGNATSGDFPQILFQTVASGEQLIALLGKPIPSPGDMYLASSYEFQLASLWPERREILSLGKLGIGSIGNLSIQAATGDRVMIFSEYWKPFSTRTHEWLPDVGPRNAKQRSVYSPDGKHYLAAEPADEPTHFVLYETANGRKLFTFPRMVEVDEAVWSSDSKSLAMIVLAKTAPGVAYREELVVYSLP